MVVLGRDGHLSDWLQLLEHGEHVLPTQRARINDASRAILGVKPSNIFYYPSMGPKAIINIDRKCKILTNFTT